MIRPFTDALIPMDLFVGKAPVTVDLVYANPVHARNIFARALYHPSARLWLHEDLARIVLGAAWYLNVTHGWTLELKDGLRTVEAQRLMQENDLVQANPQWSEPGEKRLLSPPGAGAHPRAMAVDVCVLNDNGDEIDMGTPFDYLTRDPHDNPAARNYTNLPDDIIRHRRQLEEGFTLSAQSLNLPIVLLSSEWWDFRFPADLYNQYEALSDAVLPPYMQMTGRPSNPVTPDDLQAGFDKRAEDILNDLDENL
jgi:D-alanyl-D-alanine dipeptidase